MTQIEEGTGNKTQLFVHEVLKLHQIEKETAHFCKGGCLGWTQWRIVGSNSVRKLNLLDKQNAMRLSSEGEVRSTVVPFRAMSSITPKWVQVGTMIKLLCTHVRGQILKMG